jgi:hypothetical protein
MGCMKKSEKDGYLVAAGFILAGLLFIYSGWGEFNLTFAIGLIVSILGLAGFKYPSVAEVLVHWHKGRSKKFTSSQKQTSGSRSTNIQTSGDVYFNTKK